MGQDSFVLHSNYTPSGDQPEAIAKLIVRINSWGSLALEECRMPFQDHGYIIKPL